MITVRAADARGRADFGWLDSRHSFSFGHYYDPDHMGFGVLRVINEDRVRPGAGFATHGHRDMEIITYVLDGALEHKDSIGTGSVIRPGEVQRMTAGTGILHSEFNHSATRPVHLLQIWIVPERPGLAPGYEQRDYNGDLRSGLRLIASRDGRDGALTIHQDVDLWAARLNGSGGLTHRLAPGRRAWIQLVRGAAAVNGLSLAAGDGAAIEAETELALNAAGDDGSAELLLFDLP